MFLLTYAYRLPWSFISETCIFVHCESSQSLKEFVMEVKAESNIFEWAIKECQSYKHLKVIINDYNFQVIRTLKTFLHVHKKLLNFFSYVNLWSVIPLHQQYFTLKNDVECLKRDERTFRAYILSRSNRITQQKSGTPSN